MPHPGKIPQVIVVISKFNSYYCKNTMFCAAITLFFSETRLYVYLIYTRKNAACQMNWPQQRKQSLRAHTSNSFVQKHVVFLFVFVCCCFFSFLFFLLPPVFPHAPAPLHRLALSAARHPAMLNPRSRDRWRKRGQTSLPISWGAIIMANSCPPGPGSRKRSETGKVKSVQCLNTFCCRICLDLVYCLTLSIFCLTGNCWCAFPLSTHHETSSMYF